MSGAVSGAAAGEEMYRLVEELYPICRSITGNGVRQTLSIVGQHLPLHVYEIPTGTQVFDWTVPKEWNIRDAYIKDAEGRRVVDFRASNLHVVSYSTPVHQWMSLDDLRPHLFTLVDHPDWVPYRTSYYAENWGFCLSQRVLDGLGEGTYEVCIDSTLQTGSLTYAECYLPGDSADEVLLSCHVCHPSLCNDNLSGIAVATAIGGWLASASRRNSYRLLFIPGTIGSITWLARNEPHVARIRHGLVLTGLGDPGRMTYKRSRRGDTEIDRAVAHVLATSSEAYQLLDFDPYGYDERQFCSPGFNLPVGRLGRSPHHQYPQYHSSADDLTLVRPEYLGDSLSKLTAIIEVLEDNGSYQNLNPKCEPQLGRRGLYRALGGSIDQHAAELALLWVLNLSDGMHSLLDIAARAGLGFAAVRDTAKTLSDHGLLAPVPEPDAAPQRTLFASTPGDGVSQQDKIER